MDDQVIDTIRHAVSTGELSRLGGVLADDVRWYGNFPGGGCRSRDDVLAALGRALVDETGRRLEKIGAADDQLVLRLDIQDPDDAMSVWLVLTLDGDGRI